VGKYEVLFCESFVDEVLDGGVDAAVVVRFYDFLGELGEQRGGNIVESQIH
jgi:hypothetical protein